MTSQFAEPETITSIEECYFYHVMDLPGYGQVGHEWDLRDRVDDYLGGVSWSGKRVLEIGPASGFLTFHIEQAGANVIAVELGPEASWDVVPHNQLDLPTLVQQRRAHMERLRRGFWFAHSVHQSSARVFHGDVYALPDELGRFDSVVLSSVLLHTREPLRIIEQCARFADELVIVERFWPDLQGKRTMRLAPSAGSAMWDTWWDFSPDVLSEFAGILGYRTTTTRHNQIFLRGTSRLEIPMFTIVARR